MKFSIVVPIYNCQSYLHRMIDSCRAQTYANWEALCVDDGSDDDSFTLLRQATSGDSRFKVFGATHQGVSCARNFALDNATGDVLIFIDADDFISPYLLELLSEIFRDSTVDAVHYGLSIVPQNESHAFARPVIKWRRTHKNPFDLILKPWHPWSVSVCRTAFRRSLANDIRFQTGIGYAEDVLFKFTLLGRIKKIIEIDSELYAYVQSSNSTIRRPMHKKRIDDLVFVIRELDRIYHKSPKLLGRLRKELFPRMIKNFWKLTENAPVTVREELIAVFGRELANLVNEKILPYSGFSLSKRFKLWRQVHHYSK